MADGSWERSGPEPAIAAPDAPEPEEPRAVPSLDELVKQIPAGARELLDDLFRAKFATVQRIPAAALKRETEERS